MSDSDAESERESRRDCDWCEAPAELNKDIYYACDEHEQDLTELVEL